MKINYISLIGGLFMSAVFIGTIKITLSNPTDTNVMLSVSILLLAIWGIYKAFKTKKAKKKDKNELIPVE